MIVGWAEENSPVDCFAPTRSTSCKIIGHSISTANYHRVGGKTRPPYLRRSLKVLRNFATFGATTKAQ